MLFGESTPGSLPWESPASLRSTCESRMKASVRALLSSRWVAPLWSSLLRGRVPIFTLHRFAVPDLQTHGHDPFLLRKTLERLRRERYNFIGLEDLVKNFNDRRRMPGRTVVFTVDDGYSDFALVAADVFLAYDCPVTVFVPTGFIDGVSWLWWDQVAHIALTTTKPTIGIALGNENLNLKFLDRTERLRIAHEVNLKLTSIEESMKREFICRFSLAAEVELPQSPPAGFAPMDWVDVRKLEARGVTFGPHSVTHPVLTCTTHVQAAEEIRESWRVLSERATRPVRIFSYPNGSFGDREINLVAATGLESAVTSAAGYASAQEFHKTPTTRFTVPRFPYPDGSDSLCLTASGLARVALPVQRAIQSVRRVDHAS